MRIFLLTLGHFVSDFYSNFLPALLPVALATLGLSLTSSGLLVMAHAFTSSALQPLFGYYVDKSGYTWLLLFTLPVSAIFISMAAQAGNYPMLFVFVVISGLGTSLFHPLGSSLVGKVTSERNKALAMALFIGGGNFGFAIAPAVVIYVLVNYGPTYLPWLIIPGVVATSLFVMNGLHRIPLSKNKTAGQPLPAWYKSGSLLKLNCVMGLKSWTQVALPTFLPIWTAEQGYSPTITGHMLTVYLTAGAIGSLFGGYIADKTGKKLTIAASFLICLPAMYYLVIAEDLTPLTWLALAVAGGALQSTMPPSVVWAQNMIPGNAAMASGMMLGLAFGLGGLGTALTGAIADIWGLKTAMLWTLLPLAIAFPLTCRIPENSSPKHERQTSNKAGF